MRGKGVRLSCVDPHCRAVLSTPLLSPIQIVRFALPCHAMPCHAMLFIDPNDNITIASVTPTRRGNRSLRLHTLGRRM